MTSTQENAPGPEASAVFRKVAECLCKHESSEVYYALVKRSGKQFRRSLKTTDRPLANRRLADFREKVGGLNNGTSARKVSFDELAARWLGTIPGGLKESSARRLEICFGQLKPFFGFAATFGG